LPKQLYSSRWFSIYEGYEATLYINAPSGVMIVPVTPQGEVILISEPPAYGSGEMTLFLPSGALEPDEETALCANRELQEEIGFAAGRLDRLAALHPWVKYLTATLTVYLARDLTPSRLQGDETWEIVPEYVPLDSFERLIAEGRLTDSTVIAALFLARQWLAAEG
jgi:ADP compounds hydrolase